MKFIDLPELINSELSLNFAEVTGEIFLKPIAKQLQKRIGQNIFLDVRTV